MPSDGISAAAYNVYTGYWINWSRGPVLGATLTLNRQDGSLMIAFIAFYVTLVTTSLWRIICFGLHSYYSTSLPSDALHHQRQVLFRNSSSPNSAVRTTIHLITHWRGRGGGIWRRTLLALGLSLLCTCVFTLASGFSSRVASGDVDEVLVDGRRCGFVDMSLAADNLTSNFQLATPARAEEVHSADAYARQCYVTSPYATGALTCDTLTKTRLVPDQLDVNASCPFKNNICVGDTGNIRLDTGYIDSHEDLGRNTPREKRFRYRRVLQCAPLKTEGYKTYVNISDSDTRVRYHYGKSIAASGNLSDFTEEFSTRDTYTSQDFMSLHGDSNLDYNIRFDHAQPSGNGTIDPRMSSFFPIPELASPDADVFVFFLNAAGVLFFAPVLDPWYKATRFDTSVRETADLSGNGRVYRQDEPGSPLACREQHQLCFPSDQDSKLPDSCTPLSTRLDLLSPPTIAKALGVDSGERWDAVNWMMNTTIARMIRTLHPIAVLGIQALTSRASIDGGHQGPLPVNQWQLDVQHWHATAMAHLQARFLNAAIGPRNPQLDSIFRFASTDEEKHLCNNQKVHDAGYTSFSMVGLITMLVGGAIIVLLSLFLQPILAYISKRRMSGQSYAQFEWISNETLQLHRLAHEGIGSGTWSGATNSVPFTTPGELLDTLDVINPNHPKLSSLRGGSKVSVVEVVHSSSSIKEKTAGRGHDNL
ncbi:hypothetical protein OQA88_2626 [Cercophora sp. LCS_1]